jgi:hypothetical protein
MLFAFFWLGLGPVVRQPASNTRWRTPPLLHAKPLLVPVVLLLLALLELQLSTAASLSASSSKALAYLLWRRWDIVAACVPQRACRWVLAAWSIGRDRMHAHAGLPSIKLMRKPGGPCCSGNQG